MSNHTTMSPVVYQRQRTKRSALQIGFASLAFPLLFALPAGAQTTTTEVGASTTIADPAATTVLESEVTTVPEGEVTTQTDVDEAVPEGGIDAGFGGAASNGESNTETSAVLAAMALSGVGVLGMVARRRRRY